MNNIGYVFKNRARILASFEDTTIFEMKTILYRCKTIFQEKFYWLVEMISFLLYTFLEYFGKKLKWLNLSNVEAGNELDDYEIIYHTQLHEDYEML